MGGHWVHYTIITSFLCTQTNKAKGGNKGNSMPRPDPKALTTQQK